VLTVNTQFERDLTKRIDEEIERLRGVLGAGKLTTMEDYRDYCGQITGLERAKSYCDEVNTILSQR
jgi:hypothetical protein